MSNPSDAVKAVRGALKQDQTVALRILRDGQVAETGPMRPGETDQAELARRIYL